MGRFGWPYIYDLAKLYSLINDLASIKIFLINWILCAIFTWNWKTMHNTIYSCFRIIISYFVLWNILFKVSTKSVLFSAIAESLNQIKIPHAVFVVNIPYRRKYYGYTCRFAGSFLSRRQSANWPAFATSKLAKPAKVKDGKKPIF